MHRFLSALLNLALCGKREGLSIFGVWLKYFSRSVIHRSKLLEQDWKFKHEASGQGSTWPDTAIRRIVYDFGANKGFNIPYYLDLGFDVIAVEANPRLCDEIKKTYANDRRVIVENVCLVPESSEEAVSFFVHKFHDVLSAINPPIGTTEDFIRSDVPVMTPQQLILKHGKPFYIKIDLEGMDAPIVEACLKADLNIPYISAEIHSIEPFCHLVAAGFREFKVVESPFVGNKYYEIIQKGNRSFSFKYQSAGPFGEDIPGEWLSTDEMFEYLQVNGIGWKDLHARRLARISDG